MDRTPEVPLSGPISREDRVALASRVHGLYLIGQASCEAQRLDEDCAMDNARVPQRYEELTAEDRKALAAAVPFLLDVSPDEWPLLNKAARLAGQTPEDFALEASLRSAEVTLANTPASPPSLPGLGQVRPVFQVSDTTLRKLRGGPRPPSDLLAR